MKTFWYIYKYSGIEGGSFSRGGDLYMIKSMTKAFINLLIKESKNSNTIQRLHIKREV